MAKTIEEIKKAKVELESKVLTLLKSFEDDNDIKLGYINAERERPKSTKDGYHPRDIMPEEMYDDMPYANVEIGLRIE